MSFIVDETLRLSQELNRTIEETKIIVKAFDSIMSGRRYMNHKSNKEDHMDSIRDAIVQTAAGRSMVVKVNETMRARAIKQEQARENARKERQKITEIRGRYQSLKDLIHYTFVTYPNQTHKANRFDVYKMSKSRAWEIATEGGEEYNRVTKILQFAPTSPNSFREAVSVFTDSQHNFSEYDSSDHYSR